MGRTLPTRWRLLVSTTRSASPGGFWGRIYRCCAGTAFLIGVLIPLELFHGAALWLDELLFPRYRKTKVERPLFIVGPPRSGTTLLHRLIAQDEEQFTTFPLWELLLAPAIWQKYVWLGLFKLDTAVGGPFRRLLQFVERRLTRSLDVMHPTSLVQPEEDYLLLLPQRACFVLVGVFPYCDAIWDLGRLDERIADSDQRRLFSRYRALVQRHLYVRGRGRTFLSKNPSFSGSLSSLHREFPDARFIGLLRSPEQTIPSQLSILRGPMKCFGNDVSQAEVVERFVDLFAGYYESVIDSLREFGYDQARLIRYSELKAQPAGEMICALRQLGYAAGEENIAHLHAAGERASAYKSQHRYSLSEFGLSESALRAKLPRAYEWLQNRNEGDLAPLDVNENIAARGALHAPRG